MSWLRYLHRSRYDRQRGREVASYLEIETDENIARGMAPEEAVAAARRKFGNPTLVREEIYRMNTIVWLESLAQDVRYGVRSLLSSPAFALVAVLSLALGIGANTAIFELFNAVRLRSLPVRNPVELAEVRIVGGNNGMGVNGPYGALTRPIWEEIRRDHPAFSGVFAWSERGVGVGKGADFHQATGIIVSGEFFQVLGIEPWRGRMLAPEDEHACNDSTAVVSHAYWQSKMNGREINANTKLLINDDLKQVVGVTPPSFLGLAVGEHFDIALPFCRPKELSRNQFEVSVMGRLGTGRTLAAASAQLGTQSPAIMEATEITGYDSAVVKRYRAFRLAAFPAASGVSYLRNDYDSSLQLLLAITGLVLLIACANLANLILARASTREREVALRLALGAGRSRIVRQLLSESILLASVGAGLGIILAEGLSRLLVRSLATSDSNVTLPLGTDWHVLFFAAGVAALTCMIFGMAPAFRASGLDPVTTMRTGSRGTGSRERYRLQRAMVITQISVSLMLLTAALLFVRSFYNLTVFNPGMREEGVSLGFVGFQKSNLPQDRLEEFKRDLISDLERIPGVLSAAVTTNVPLTGSSWGHGISIGAVEGNSMFTWVGPHYFETLGIPLLAGRQFSDSDTASSERVAVVNQKFVQQYLNGQNPIGRSLRTHPEPGYPATVYQIVGVIPDTSYACLRCGIPPMALAPAPQFPSPQPWTAMLIRSSIPPANMIEMVKRRIAEKHPEIIAQFQVYQTRIRDGLVRERLMATLSGFFGVLAALLGMIGLYGVISYIVTRRSSEIGIRLALGASRRQVLGMVMREAGTLLTAGIVIGTVLSLVAGRGAESLLFGLKSYDLLTLATAAGLLIVIGALASFLPARRASKLDPMNALRCE